MFKFSCLPRYPVSCFLTHCYTCLIACLAEREREREKESASLEHHYGGGERERGSSQVSREEALLAWLLKPPSFLFKDRWRKRNDMQRWGYHHNTSSSSSSSLDTSELAMEKVERLASENAVVVFSFSSCCMCHVVKRLFCSLGVNLTVYELDEEGDGQELKEALDIMLMASSDSSSSFLPPPSSSAGSVPAVFIGGKLVGGLDRVMAAHISGALVPLLREAGALWL